MSADLKELLNRRQDGRVYGLKFKDVFFAMMLHFRKLKVLRSNDSDVRYQSKSIYSYESERIHTR